MVTVEPLRKHAYPNILIISPLKTENFQIKNSDIFHISAQNIDCGYSLEPPRRGGSNEYPQSMCLSRNKKNNVYPCKPQFYYIKVGFKGVKIIQVCFRDDRYSLRSICLLSAYSVFCDSCFPFVTSLMSQRTTKSYKKACVKGFSFISFWITPRL